MVVVVVVVVVFVFVFVFVRGSSGSSSSRSSRRSRSSRTSMISRSSRSSRSSRIGSDQARGKMKKTPVKASVAAKTSEGLQAVPSLTPGHVHVHYTAPPTDWVPVQQEAPAALRGPPAALRNPLFALRVPPPALGNRTTGGALSNLVSCFEVIAGVLVSRPAVTCGVLCRLCLRLRMLLARE